MVPRETENNAYAKFWGDKQRELWYVMVFLEWSISFFFSPSRCFEASFPVLLEYNRLISNRTGTLFDNGKAPEKD